MPPPPSMPFLRTWLEDFGDFNFRGTFHYNNLLIECRYQWDAEILTSYGWIECVGCADRSAYDLSVHAKKTGASLCARERLAEPIEVTEWEVNLVRKLFGPLFRKEARFIEAAIFETTQSQRAQFAEDLKTDGFFVIDVPGIGEGKVNIPYEVIEIEQKTKTVNYHEYIPHVIEPSFGIGRIL